MRKELEEFLSLKSHSLLQLFIHVKADLIIILLIIIASSIQKFLFNDNHFDCLMRLVSVTLSFDWRRLDPDPF